MLKFIPIICFITLFGCSAQETVNKGTIKRQAVDCTQVQEGHTDLVTVRNTPWWYILDSSSKGYCSKFGGKITWTPLNADTSDLFGELSGSPLGTVASKIVPTIPLY